LPLANIRRRSGPAALARRDGTSAAILRSLNSEILTPTSLRLLGIYKTKIILC